MLQYLQGENMNSFESRINLNSSLQDLSIAVCKHYKLGQFKTCKLIEIGYEDFNFILVADNKKYLVKALANFRSKEDCENLTARAVAACEHKISCPRIYEVNGKFLNYITLNENTYRIIVMDLIDGKDFYSLGQLPNDDELKIIAKELAKLNNIDFKPPFIYDHWAIINFEKEYQENIHLITGQDRILIDGVFESFKEIDMHKLKFGFVHGDIIVTNIIKENETGKLFFIDFSVSNYQPRIVDMAVSLCDLCLDLDDQAEIKKRMNLFIKAYESISPLSDYEKKCLNVFLAAHQAMTIIQTTREKLLNTNDSEENEDFLRKGQEGLRMVLNHLI